MWRLLIALGLLLGLGGGAAEAQEWRGTAGFDLSGGYQTNLYLDPVLGTWNPDVSPELVALTPQVGLTRNASRTRMDLTVQSRMHPRRADVPQLTQSTLRLRYRLTSEWTLGTAGGGTRYRFTTTQTNFSTVRDHWWLLPALQWTPTSKTMISLRTGITQRYERSFEPTDRQTSGLASLRATHWFTDRFRGGAQLYVSDGRTSVAETGFGGSGGTLSGTFWPSESVSVRAEVGIEQLRYDLQTTSSTENIRDEIGRAGMEVDWHVRPTVTLFGRAEGMVAELGREESNESAPTDLHVSGGVRLQMQRVFGGSSEPAPRQRVCDDTDEGLLLRVPYEGDGTVHVTGDFNNWSLPGVPLDPADGDTWQTTLDLPPGRYVYRLRVVEDGEARWLDLPSYAQTVEDDFGGTNGVCIAH